MAEAHPLSDPSTWVAQHGDYLYRNALLRLGDREAAEEVVQETLLAALQGRGQFSGRAAEHTWMVGILKHKVIDHLRRAGRETPLEDEGLLPCEEEEPFAGEGEWRGHWRNAALAPADWGNTPAALLAESRRLAAIIEATSDYVGIADLDGASLYINQAGRRMVGLSDEEYRQPRNVANCYPEQEFPRIGEMVRTALEGGVWAGELTLLHKAGHQLSISEVTFPLRDTGIGMAPERMHRLFRSFSQIDASTTRE